MAALLGGLAAIILGVIGVIIWWGYFVKALMAGVPALLVLGGALAAYLGFEEIRDKRASEQFDTEKEDLKKEVENLKEELRELKGKKEEEKAGEEEKKE